jgi:hypothetical protein
MDPRIKAGIFHGESGGDYNALFGFSNRSGGRFADTKLTDMTVDEAIQFAHPSGPYASWVRSQIGRTATPMGGFQIVGNTLKQAKKWAGLRGDEKMTPEIQDRIGEAILTEQGTGAWAGYRGPRTPKPDQAPTSEGAYDPRSDTPSSGRPTGSKLPGPSSQYDLPTQGGATQVAATGDADVADLANLYSKMYGTKTADRKTPGEIMGGAIANMGADPGKVGMGNAPQLPQVAPSILPAMPTIDPGQQDMRRQQLAMAMQRLNSNQLW